MRRIYFSGSSYVNAEPQNIVFGGNFLLPRKNEFFYSRTLYVSESSFSFYGSNKKLEHRKIYFTNGFYVNPEPQRTFFSNTTFLPKIKARVYEGVVELTYNISYAFIATPSFNVSLTCSPSPAYVRLTDTSNVPIEYENSTTRIWNIVNNRSSEQIIFSTLENPVEIVIDGVWGDTFDISLIVEY